MMTINHEEFMRLAIQEANKSSASGMPTPYGAVIAKNGDLISSAYNTVKKSNDPTSHAEIVAIRKACEILKKVEDMELVKGMRMNTKIGTIIFIACRNTKNNTNIRDIMKATNIGHQEISKCYKRMKPAMPGQQLTDTSTQVAEAAARKLKLDEEVVDLIRNTAENISRLEVLTGKKPATIAGVAILMIIQHSPWLSDRLNCQKISSLLGIGESAIKNAFRDVEDL